MSETAISHEEPRIETPESQTATGSGIYSQQYSAAEGGVETDIYCPACGEEVNGSYLPMFRCPHCEMLIFRDDKGNVTNYEQKHTCPECGHTFGEMSDEEPTEFRRFIRNFEQKTEGVILGLDRVFSRMLA